jgi:hypothetical protein
MSVTSLQNAHWAEVDGLLAIALNNLPTLLLRVARSDSGAWLAHTRYWVAWRLLVGSGSRSSQPLLLAVAVGVASGRAGTKTVVVLRSVKVAGPNTVGWGTPHPSKISNGGDPTGLVTGIHWSSAHRRLSTWRCNCCA